MEDAGKNLMQGRRAANKYFPHNVINWRRKRRPTPVFLPAKSHGQRSLAGSSPRGRRVGHDLASKAPPPMWAKKGRNRQKQTPEIRASA